MEELVWFNFPRTLVRVEWLTAIITKDKLAEPGEPLFISISEDLSRKLFQPAPHDEKKKIKCRYIQRCYA